MPSKHVAMAVDARLQAYWSETPIIDFDTQTQPPDDADAFVVVQYPIAAGVRPYLGRRFFEEGGFRIVLNVKRGIGLLQGLQWCDTLIHIFRGIKNFEDIETFTPDGPIIDDATDDGNWVSFSIIVPYRFQFESAVFEQVSV